MAPVVSTPAGPGSPSARAGDYRCGSCGYGVANRQPPGGVCPMCRSSAWREAPARAAAETR